MRDFKIITLFLAVISLLFFVKHKTIGEEKIINLDTGKQINILIKPGEKVKDYDIGKIAEGAEEYLVTLTGSKGNEYGKDIVIYSLENEREVYREDFTQLNPWKVVIGDIDGDGIDDISIGVYKESPLHPVLAKRPFIYSFVEGNLVPKWRGSRLSKPFIDYTFNDLDKDGIDEIVSIEVLEDNKKVINSYKWKGFGFEGFIESMPYDDIKGLNIKDGLIYLDIIDDNDDYLGFIKLEKNNLVIERVE